MVFIHSKNIIGVQSRYDKWVRGHIIGSKFADLHVPFPIPAATYSLLLQPPIFDLLTGVPLAGYPIGTALSLEMNISLIYPPLTTKAYGTGKKIEGRWQRRQTVVVIDDLITSSASLPHAYQPEQ